MAGTFRGMPKDFFAFFPRTQGEQQPSLVRGQQGALSRERAGADERIRLVHGAASEEDIEEFRLRSRPNGGSIFRIHRDVRFSKDKRPYKENAGCYFRHAAGRDVHAPGFYVHFAPGEVFFGGGSWMPDPAALAKIRTAIAAKPAAWNKIAADRSFKRTFGGIRGEGLRPAAARLRGDHPLIDEIKRKSFYALHDADAKLAGSPALVGEGGENFRQSRAAGAVPV